MKNDAQKMPHNLSYFYFSNFVLLQIAHIRYVNVMEDKSQHHYAQKTFDLMFYTYMYPDIIAGNITEF